MSHTCKSLIIHCIDFRIQKAVREFMEKGNLLGDCDILAVAGGIKSLVSPSRPSDKDFIFDQINTSVQLHKIQEIILANHTDCGAYGGSSKFDSASAEEEFHVNEMRAAKGAIFSKYPELTVKILLEKISPEGDVKVEEIE